MFIITYRGAYRSRASYGANWTRSLSLARVYPTREMAESLLAPQERIVAVRPVQSTL